MQEINEKKRKVYIDVLGGVAHIVSVPDDVVVYITDLDQERGN